MDNEIPQHPNCRSIMFNGHELNGHMGVISVVRDPEAKQRHVLRYLWGRINKGREYVSLERMARDTGYSYDDCERMIAQAHVDRTIPRITILEEVEE